VEGLLAPWHLLIVFVVAVLVFGPDKLPQIARQMGRGLHEFRKVRDSFDDNVRSFLGHDDESEAPEQRELPPSRDGVHKRALPDTTD
jgi:TatA/E family protein of Tat protein translocase